MFLRMPQGAMVMGNAIDEQAESKDSRGASVHAQGHAVLFALQNKALLLQSARRRGPGIAIASPVLQ
jgi:hypothetical protein